MTAPDVGQCMHIRWANQLVEDTRYYAEPLEGFGVCVYTIGQHSRFHIQCFPIVDKVYSVDQLYSLKFHYFEHVLGRARSLPVQFRVDYPYMEATDVLSLKCLVEEAAVKWSLSNELRACDPDPGTGEGLE